MLEISSLKWPNEMIRIQTSPHCIYNLIFLLTEFSSRDYINALITRRELI
jgi:hypothetical protein